MGIDMGGSKPRASALPILAIAGNATLWGLSWWPMHALRDRGVHALWVTLLSYAVGFVLVLLWQPGSLRQLLGDKRLWLLMAASGLTNSTFNWAISIGDVVRVVLLLYLMPVWAALLSWAVFGEKPSLFTLLRIALALVGVVLVLQPPGQQWNQFVLPVPQSLPDVLALVSGFFFAVANVSLNQLGKVPAAPKMLATMTGCMLLSGFLALSLRGLGVGGVTDVPALSLSWLPWVLVVTAQLMISGFFLQYGAPHMSANTLALLMSLEVLVAAVSSVLAGTGTLGGRVILGGVLLVGAALLEAFDHLGKPRSPQSPTAQPHP